MTKSEAQQAQAEFMKEVNARTATAPDPHITFGDFLEGVALPFLRSKWKRSTRDTTEKPQSVTTCLKSSGKRSSRTSDYKGCRRFLQ
jgi:hypothetical protein